MGSYFCAFTSCLLLIAVYVAYEWINQSKRNRLPPGPRQLPVIGSIFDIPQNEDWPTYSARWAYKYGDIVHVKVMGKTMIILNSAEAATELLDKRASIYSDRPILPLMERAGLYEWNFGFMPLGKAWQARRRTFASLYGRSNPITYPSHDIAVSKLLKNILNDPENFREYIRLHSGQLIVDVTYGLPISSCEDRLITTAEDVMGRVAFALRPVMWVINPLSLSDYLPDWMGGRFIREFIEKWRSDLEELRHYPFNIVKRKTNAGPSFVSRLLADIDPNSGAEYEDLIRDCAAIAYGAGSDSTVSAERTFFLTMALHPETQQKAQDEIDSVVGDGRLPDFRDREHLPYVTAVIKENLRWHPPAPQGIPHLLRQDDEYRGYTLPKDALVVGNIWQILHDPRVYPDPLAYKPERFMKGSPSECTAGADPLSVAFGFGRRICPGRALAEDSIWLLTARVLATFNISWEGEKPPAEYKDMFSPTAITHPLPFRCKIVPRSKSAVTLVSSG